MPNRAHEPGLQRVQCDECGAYPQVYWDNTAETVALVCTCGERLVPRDAVLEHDLMPEGTNWSVVEKDGDP